MKPLGQLIPFLLLAREITITMWVCFHNYPFWTTCSNFVYIPNSHTHPSLVELHGKVLQSCVS